MDSSYSVNTQWPISHLQSVLGSGETASENAKVGGDERWMNCAQYLKERWHGATPGDPDPQPTGAVPPSAETRSELVVAELTFTVPASAAAGTGAVAEARLRGVLTDGSTYECRLPAPGRSAAERTEPAAETELCDLIGQKVGFTSSNHPLRISLVGMTSLQTADGWYVKVTGVSLPARAASDLVLLSHSKGYDFRNRLVTAAEAHALLA
jgi:hypothetical protein